MPSGTCANKVVHRQTEQAEHQST